MHLKMEQSSSLGVISGEVLKFNKIPNKCQHIYK